MRILAFDQSVRACACVQLQVVRNNDFDKVKIVVTNVLTSKSTGVYRLAQLRDFIDEQLKFEPTLIVRELHNQRQFGAAGQLHMVSGLIDIAAYDAGVVAKGNYASIPVTVWKKFCFGKGNLKKDTAYMVHMNTFLSRTKYFVRPTADYQVFDDNIGDALCLGITTLCAYNIRESRPAGITDAKVYQNIKDNVPLIFDCGINK